MVLVLTIFTPFNRPSAKTYTQSNSSNSLFLLLILDLLRDLLVDLPLIHALVLVAVLVSW